MGCAQNNNIPENLNLKDAGPSVAPLKMFIVNCLIISPLYKRPHAEWISLNN